MGVADRGGMVPYRGKGNLLGAWSLLVSLAGLSAGNPSSQISGTLNRRRGSVRSDLGRCGHDAIQREWDVPESAQEASDAGRGKHVVLQQAERQHSLAIQRHAAAGLSATFARKPLHALATDLEPTWGLLGRG